MADDHDTARMRASELTVGTREPWPWGGPALFTNSTVPGRSAVPSPEAGFLEPIFTRC